MLAFLNPKRAGNMTICPMPSDLTANFTLTFDAWNRLVKVEDGETTVAEYEYDGLNHRTVKKTYESDTLVETRHFYYDKDWRCLEERVGESSDADRRYVWGMTYIDDLILRDRIDGETTERLWAMTDANYNVVELIEITNGGWTINDLERYTYDAYGTPTVRDLYYNVRTTGTAYDWQHLFTGQRIDPETGLYHYRNRQYHPALGRFVTRDPIGYVDCMNLFEYVLDSPPNYTDYSGLQAWPSGYPGGPWAGVPGGRPDPSGSDSDNNRSGIIPKRRSKDEEEACMEKCNDAYDSCMSHRDLALGITIGCAMSGNLLGVGAAALAFLLYGQACKADRATCKDKCTHAY